MGPGLIASNTSAEGVRRRMRLLVLLSLVCAFQFYLNLPVLDHGWVNFDDDINIVLNPHLTGLTSDSVKWAWTDASYMRRYLPLGWTMFDGLFRLGGLNAALFHAAGWLLSAANAVLLFLLARRFIKRGSPAAPATAWEDLSAALAVALLSVHPLRAETIGWASGLLYLGSTFLASLAVLASFPDRPEPTRHANEWLGRLLFLFSLLFYPVLVGLPLLLIVAACCIPSAASLSALPAILWKSIRRYASWLIISLLVGGYNVVAAASSRTYSTPGGLVDYSFASRLAHSASMLGHFTAQTLWPAVTSPFYGEMEALPATHKLFLPLGALAMGLILLAWPRTRFAAILSIAALLATVLPFIGLIDKDQGANDRYTFLLLGTIAVGLASLLTTIPGRTGRLIATAGVVTLTALLLPSYRESLAVWRTTATLQARVDAVTAAHPNVRLGFARPAMSDFMSGHYAESQQRLRRGFGLFGSHPELLGAATFIEETRTSLTGDGRDPSMPPYAFMHLDIAKKHREAGHAYAARVHADYARQLMAAATEEK